MDIIVDIDGTISDCRHRMHHILKDKKDWDAFHAEIHLDQPIQPVASIVRSLQPLSFIIICTGRPVEYRKQTLEWLDKHKIRANELFMRCTGDYRPADIVKEEMLHVMHCKGHNPQLAFEDKQSCVDMWRRNGIICLQNSMKELP
jgi:uncharacterized HAD superfamily protein